MNHLLIQGDSRRLPLEDKSVNCCVTSPPYFGLRDYGVGGQIGLESTPQLYVTGLIGVFREVRRVLRDDGTCWLVLGDSYNGSGKGGNPEGSPHLKQRGNAGSLTVASRKTSVPGLASKQLLGIPWRVALALQDDGWILRCDVIWEKPNAMTENVRDRPSRSHEYLFLLAKRGEYYYDGAGAKEPAVGGLGAMRNRRSVWDVATTSCKGDHFATSPPKLIGPCILAGCPVGGTVLDPFAGSFTTSMVCEWHGRNSIGVELNPDYIALGKGRIETPRPEKAA